jgi:hypothetical protein
MPSSGTRIDSASLRGIWPGLAAPVDEYDAWEAKSKSTHIIFRYGAGMLDSWAIPEGANVPPRTASSQIIQELEAVVDDPEMYEQGETRPDGSVVSDVKTLIRRTEGRLRGRAIPKPVIRPLDGAIRLTWTSNSASVRVVCFRSKRDRYIYHEEIRGGRAVSHGLVRGVNPQSLAKWLKWFSFR